MTERTHVINITEAHEIVRLLRHLDGSDSDIEKATDAAIYLAARASQALQLAVSIDKTALVQTLIEVE